MTAALIAVGVLLVLSLPLGIAVGKCIRGPKPRPQRRKR